MGDLGEVSVEHEVKHPRSNHVGRGDKLP